MRRSVLCLIFLFIAIFRISAQTCVTNAGNDVAICSGSSAVIGSAPVIDVSYTWTPSAGLSNSNASDPNITLTNSGNTPIVYTYTLMAQDTSGCIATDEVQITVNPIPNITVNSATICEGETATLTAAGAANYLWSNGSTANPLSVSPSSTTSYTVTGTEFGCSNTDIATVTVNPKPAVTVNSEVICSGENATLTASGADSYLWSTGSTANPLIVSPAVTTSYTVTGTTSGCSDIAVTTVTVNPKPTISVNSATICSGQSATLTAAGASTYLWNTGSSNNLLIVSPVVTTSYTVTGTTSGCSDIAVTTVSVNPKPTVTANSATICSGQSATLTATGADAYQWNTGSSNNPLIVSPTVTTSYSVTGTTSGCSDMAITTVSVNPKPTVTVNSVAICSGQNATLTAAGAASYQWDTGSTNNPLVISPSATTSYTVTGTNSAGCSNTAVATVTVKTNPSVNVNSLTICAGKTATLTATGATSYLWNTGSTSNPLLISPSSTTSYTVTGTTSGCSNTAVATVSVNSNPTVTVNSATICAGKNGDFNNLRCFYLFMEHRKYK